MTIPHDHYLKFVENSVLEETLFFHNRGTYTVDKLTGHTSTLHHLRGSELERMTGNELPLDIIHTPTMETKLQPPDRLHPLTRNDSCEHFNMGSMPFELVKQLLTPLLKKRDSHYGRGYPSGGALYPVEVFCYDLGRRVTDWPLESRLLHLLPSSRCFEAHATNVDDTKLINALTPPCFTLGTPAIAIVYCIYLPKTIFKYRYRGYRLALMEAGSMYMLVDLKCKELNLSNRVWSGFTDHQLTCGLALNPTLFLPACIQYIGPRNE